MKRTFITAILFAITASNVNAQQSNTVVGSPQHYSVAPSGYQPYQPQYQSYVPQQGYQHQTPQAYQQQPYVPQQGAIQAYYYPHQQPAAGGVVTQPLSTPSAQLNSVMQRVQPVEAQQQVQPQQDYLALPTKARPPAPSIPPQPEDLVGLPVKSGQQSVLQSSKELHNGDQLAVQSKASVPAPSIVAQQQEPAAPSATTTVANEQEAQRFLEAAVEPKADESESVAGLMVAPETNTVEQSSQANEERVAEELAAAEVFSDTEEVIGSTEEIVGTEELAGTEELIEVKELAAAEEKAKELSEVAMAEFGLLDEAEQPQLGELAFEETEAVDSATGIDTAPGATNEGFQIAETQLPVENKTEAGAAVVATAASTIGDKVAVRKSAPTKYRRSGSYGGWILALIPLLGLPLMAWLAWRKKKQNALEARFAEAALHRVNTKKSKPSATKAASPVPVAKPVVKTATKQPTVAPTVAATSVKATATPAAATVETQPQGTKKTSTSFTVAPSPSKDVPTAGILSVDDLKGVELKGSDFSRKVSTDTESNSPSAELSPVSSATRIEIPTEVINIADRDSLTSISGIDQATQHALHKAGYLSFGDLAKASGRELQLALSKLDHQFSDSDFKRWASQAALASQGDKTAFEKQTAAPVATEASVVSDTKPVVADLTKIRGVGPATADLLRANGITNFQELSVVGLPRLREILASGGGKFAALDPSMWCRQAEFALGGSWVRSRVETMAATAEPDADSVWKPTVNPVATESVATAIPASSTSQDDLTKIAGVGPEAQELLRSNGIERFEQIGQMTADELNQLLATQGSRFQGLAATTWPVQARALTTDLTDESSVLAQVNSIIDIAKSTNAASSAKPEVSAAEAVGEKTTSE